MLNKNNSNNIVFVTEISKKHNNSKLLEIANKLYLYSLENNLINDDDLVIISYIKHFSKSIKSLTFTKNEKIIKNIKSLSLNNIILDFINKNKKKNEFDNFLVYYKDDNQISINKINSRFSLKEFTQYYQ